MRYLSLFLILISIVACQPQKVEQVVVEIPDNPLFNTFNQPIDFASVTADDIVEATEAIQTITDANLANIINIPAEQRNFENTMVALDDLYADYDMIASEIYLMSYTNPDSAIRTNALESNTILSMYGNEISLNEDLYKAIKSYSESKEASELTGYKAKFLKEEVADFERNGFALTPEKREELKAINNELSAIGDDFSQNIAAFQDFIILNEAEMDGLPEDFKEARKQEDGNYKVDLT